MRNHVHSLCMLQNDSEKNMQMKLANISFRTTTEDKRH